MMSQMIIRRIGIGIILLWVVSVLIFALTQVLPGDAAQIRLGQQATPETLAALRKELGLDKPWYMQYISWMGNLFTGNLGISAAGGATIESLIGNRIGNTVFMTDNRDIVTFTEYDALGRVIRTVEDYHGEALETVTSAVKSARSRSISLLTAVI